MDPEEISIFARRNITGRPIHSVGDSGISSEQNRQQALDRMNRFLSDTVEHSNSIANDRALLKVALNNDTDPILQYCDKFYNLAQTWLKERTLIRNNPRPKPSTLSALQKEQPRQKLDSYHDIVTLELKQNSEAWKPSIRQSSSHRTYISELKSDLFLRPTTEERAQQSYAACSQEIEHNCDDDTRILQELSDMKRVVTLSQKAAIKTANYYETESSDDASIPHRSLRTFKSRSFDSGIEEVLETAMPAEVTPATILFLLNNSSKYKFLIDSIQNLLRRKNVKNLMEEFESTLLKRAALIDKQVVRLTRSLERASDPFYSKLELVIQELRMQKQLCLQKAEEAKDLIHRDRFAHSATDSNHHQRLIYGIFLH